MTVGFFSYGSTVTRLKVGGGTGDLARVAGHIRDTSLEGNPNRFDFDLRIKPRPLGTQGEPGAGATT